MSLLVRKPPDPVNEAIRNSVEGPPNLENLILLLIQKTSRLHAGFLFDPSGKEPLQKLLQCLGDTKRGWEDFGIRLGLNPLQIKGIYHHLNVEDPAYYTLLSFVQKRDSTLDKVVVTLKNMGRLDIIINIADLLIQLADNHSTTSEEESGYFSLTSSSSAIIYPPFIPRVQLFLQTLDADAIPATTQNNSSSCTIDSDNYDSSHYENEGYQKAESMSSSFTAQKRAQYTKKVMLTFAYDGLPVAKEVAEILRSESKGQERIGVVILNDHVGKVNANPEEFIFSCFQQVDYVIPIVTEGYLRELSSSNTSRVESSLLTLDCKYAKYIYTLMNTNFLQDGCINEKVRCIIPDKLLHLTYQHDLLRSPIFRTWVKQSETKELQHIMLKSTF